MVNIEYDLENDKLELHNVIISIPLPWVPFFVHHEPELNHLQNRLIPRSCLSLRLMVSQRIYTLPGLGGPSYQCCCRDAIRRVRVLRRRRRRRDVLPCPCLIRCTGQSCGSFGWTSLACRVWRGRNVLARGVIGYGRISRCLIIILIHFSSISCLCNVLWNRKKHCAAAPKKQTIIYCGDMAYVYSPSSTIQNTSLNISNPKKN